MKTRPTAEMTLSCRVPTDDFERTRGSLQGVGGTLEEGTRSLHRSRGNEGTVGVGEQTGKV